MLRSRDVRFHTRRLHGIGRLLNGGQPLPFGSGPAAPGHGSSASAPCWTGGATTGQTNAQQTSTNSFLQAVRTTAGERRPRPVSEPSAAATPQLTNSDQEFVSQSVSPSLLTVSQLLTVLLVHRHRDEERRSDVPLSSLSWISKVLCSSVEKGFVGEGVVRWRERPSRAAHWASKASSSGGAAGGSANGEAGARRGGGAAQSSAPLKVALPLDGWRGAGGAAATAAAPDGGGGLMNGLTWHTTWGGAEAGTGNGGGGCAAEPNTLATICDGVMPTAGAPG
ncbi:hypothetical protein EYF80_050996 [Liparis tanakae]|uniref:Uncharacterized protein n=1 Tax=Liparis tanakae TaxID=230148 RepID=A0A4Z2FDI3_9TELE|nr:hypothetical protein EYF80_050996 [Liparis tanakae]